MSASEFIFEGTEFNFDQLVLENSRKGLVVVDFWAPWVGPSLRQREMLSRLAARYNGRFLLVTVNTDQQKGIADRYAVKSLPSLKLFRGGKVVESLYGAQPEQDYQAAVDRFLVGLGDKVRLAAGKAWNQGSHDLAIQTLVEGAMAEPENLEIPAMLGKLLMRLNRFDEARSVLVALPAEARASAPIAPLLAHLEFITSAGVVEGVTVGVKVGVKVAVWVGVAVREGVSVGVSVGVKVGVKVRVGVLDGVIVGVGL